MKKLVLFSLVLCCSSQVLSQFKVTICLLAKAPSAENIFIAGPFNQWRPDDTASMFSRKSDSLYVISIPNTGPGWLEFKCTRGSWQRVECKSNGADIENHSIWINSDTTYYLRVNAWKDQFAQQPRAHTASRQVMIIDSVFFIPQLHRYRRIWAYLPSDYQSTNKHYPVLYMQDGQNLFDDFTSAYGEWGIDELLDSLPAGSPACIVIGIDNGAGHRMSEYDPYDFKMTEQRGDTVFEGEGKAYVDFMVQTLKPYVDKKFRTLPDARHCLVAGSSMGGVISLYAVMRYPDIFGGAGIFSPAFWTAEGLAQDVRKFAPGMHARIYFYAGDAESKNMVSNMQAIVKMLRSNPAVKTKVAIAPGGKHNEANWHAAFPAFYQWILDR